jgi:uncharacterized membrane protein YfcA
MESVQIVLILIALGASVLTFFSGFGLGSILLPVFALFMPVEAAILSTAIVHLSNNLLKLALTYRNIHYRILLLFGISGIVGALAGAGVLQFLSHLDAVRQVSLMGFSWNLHPLKTIIGSLLVGFSILEFPGMGLRNFPRTWLIPGGVLSGFFGGLSGHQGALRSAFLVRVGLEKNAFVATGVAIACAIDLSRIPVYLSGDMNHFATQGHLIWPAVVGAAIGAFGGKYLLKKLTLKFLQTLVAVGIMAIGLGMVVGVL